MELFSPFSDIATSKQMILGFGILSKTLIYPEKLMIKVSLKMKEFCIYFWQLSDTNRKSYHMTQILEIPYCTVWLNKSDLIIQIIRIIRNTFERLKFGQIMPKKARNSQVSDNVCISQLNILEFFIVFILEMEIFYLD